MATSTLGPGKVRFAWLAPTTTFASLPWATAAGVAFYSTTVLNSVNRISTNALGYQTNKPSSAIKPFTLFEQVATGALPNVYEMDLKIAIIVSDNSLISLYGPTTVVTNAKPVISLVSPAAGAIYAPGATILLVANATDDGSVSMVEFFNNAGNSIGLGTKNGNQYTVSYTAPGALGGTTVTARATDNTGLTEQASLSITIQNAAAPVQLSVPTGISATPLLATPTTGLSVTANSVPNATGYRVYNSPTQNGSFLQLGGTITSLPYSHTGLSPLQTQWYKLQAVGNGGSYTDSVLTSAFSGTTSDTAQSTQPTTYLVVLGGQSNAQGLAPRSELWEGTFKDVQPSFTRQFQRAKVWNPNTGQIEKLQVGSVNHSTTGVGIAGNEQGQQSPERPANYEDGFGYMIPLAQQFELQHPTGTDEICFIITAAGATPIDRFLENDQSTNSLYYNILKSRYNTTVAALQADNRKVVLLGYLWKQGEADVANPNYKDTMISYAVSLRKIMGSTLKIVVDSTKEAAALNLQKQAFVAQDSNAVYNDMSGATRIFDNLHIDAKSIIYYGMGANYNILFGTNVSAPIPASMPGGYGWLSYLKSYLPGTTPTLWKNYAGRDAYYDFFEAAPNLFTVATGRTGKQCLRSDGVQGRIRGKKPEIGNSFTFIYAVDLADEGRWQGLMTSGNLFLSAGDAFKEIYDGRDFQSDHNLKTAVGRICVITFCIAGYVTNGSYIRLNGVEVWRGTTNYDQIQDMFVGQTDSYFMKGDLYAFLLSQGALSTTETAVHENVLAAELGVVF